MISDEELDKLLESLDYQRELFRALIYLANTDVAISEAKGAMVDATNFRKRMKAHLIMSGSGGIGLRTAAAENSVEYAAAEKAETKAMVDYEKLLQRRHTASKKIDIIRTLESSRRQGA